MNDYLKETMIGRSYFFRTVTYHSVGRVVAFFDDFVMLEDASWVIDSGIFSSALKFGVVAESEPTGICYIKLDVIVDFFPWNHELPMDRQTGAYD